MNNKLTFALNRDTGYLKLIAFVTMLIDHVGAVFFPDQQIWRVVGRISFPLFALCLVFGFLYTHDVKKYALRLLVFAAVSEIPYILAFYPDSVAQLFDPLWYGSLSLAWSNICFHVHLNIGFTLLLGLLAIYGVREKKYILTVGMLVLSFFPGVEYGFYGVFLIVLLYLFRDKSAATFAIGIGIYLAAGFLDGDKFYSLFGLLVNPQGYALLALPFMLIHTDTKIKIPRWLNYGFYPAHLLIIYLVSLLLP